MPGSGANLLGSVQAAWNAIVSLFGTAPVGSAVQPCRQPCGNGPYATQDLAAKAALRAANPDSIRDNREYAGLIYRDGTSFYYTGPIQGSDQGANPSAAPAPAGAQVVGDYHTHADYSTVDPVTGAAVRTGDPAHDDFNSDNFSATDRRGIAGDGLAILRTLVRAVLMAVVALYGAGWQMATSMELKVLSTVAGEGFLAIQTALSGLGLGVEGMDRYKLTAEYKAGAVAVTVMEGGPEVTEPIVIARREVPRDKSGVADCPSASAGAMFPARLDTVLGRDLLPIHIASRVFRAKGLPLACYQITVMKEGDATVVAFTDLEALPGGRGGRGLRPGFEVRMEGRDHHVTQANFIR